MKTFPPPMRPFRVRYVCGECGYDQIDWWDAHKRHYRRHQDPATRVLQEILDLQHTVVPFLQFHRP